MKLFSAHIIQHGNHNAQVSTLIAFLSHTVIINAIICNAVQRKCHKLFIFVVKVVILVGMFPSSFFHIFLS